MYKELQKFREASASLKYIVVLSGTLLFFILMRAISSQPFFEERLVYFKMNRLIPSSVAFCIIISYIIFSRKKKYSNTIAIFCLGVTFIDLVFFTALTTYTRAAERGDLVVPEKAEQFEYKKVRMESFWPSNIRKVDKLRPSMLYLQPSLITEKKNYYHSNFIFTENREYDFYMLRKFWDAYKRFPEAVKRVVMGVDMPKLVFFTDYKVMGDEDVFRESQNLNPELLKHYLYLAPDNYETLPPPKSSTEQAESAIIEVEHFDNNRLSLSVDTKEEGLLYYSDGYDEKWKCFIDGKEHPIHRANIAFKAVFIPEGRHNVLFVYRPVFYLVSLWLFLAACAMGFISIWWSWLRSR